MVRDDEEGSILRTGYKFDYRTWCVCVCMYFLPGNLTLSLSSFLSIVCMIGGVFFAKI